MVAAGKSQRERARVAAIEEKRWNVPMARHVRQVTLRRRVRGSRLAAPTARPRSDLGV
jgi:hypothetical protein